MNKSPIDSICTLRVQHSAPPATQRKPVGATDSYVAPDGSEPERDEYGRVVITKNVVITVNPKVCF